MYEAQALVRDGFSQHSSISSFNKSSHTQIVPYNIHVALYCIKQYMCRLFNSDMLAY